MKCEKCGAEILDIAKFCGKCGAKLAPKIDSDKTVLLTDGDKTVLLTNENNAQSVSDKTVLLADSDKTVLLNQGTNMNDNSDNRENMFGTYKILGVIGQGSGGIVYKALHTRLCKEVVIKQIKNPNGTLNRHETDLLKKIKHSFLPQVLDFIEQNGECFTVMDFISGSDIENLVKSGRKFSNREIIKISKELCEAVSYLHELKPPVIHSDIKPSNVMLNENGDICLIDFNVSLVFNKNVSVIGGTCGYAAPEQFGIPLADIGSSSAGELTIGKIAPSADKRSDVYSIGAFMYFMITGETPDINYRTKPIFALRPDALDGLVKIVSKAMELNPAARYKSASEMLVAIMNIGKLDKRYKALKFRRIITTAAAAIAVGGFLALAVNGKNVLEQEHEEKYQNYVTEISECVSDKDFDKAELIINSAVDFEPTRIEPYFNRAKVYYLQKDWEKCEKYPDLVLNDEILNNDENDISLVAEMYEMSAESAFEQEKYDVAIIGFNKALSYSDEIVNCYRDLTISYARTGDIEKAEKSLEIAKERGFKSDVIELMQGEISAAKGEIDAAYKSFLKAIELTEDDYIRFRAILVCDKTLLSDNSKQNAEKMIALIENQQARVSEEYRGIVKEMLANDYAAAEQYKKASEIYEELLENGELDYSLQKNYFNILYSKLEDYEKCIAALNKIKIENPEDYWAEMNLAYVFISIENKKTQSERNYSSAYESYNKAEELYSVYVKNGKSDPNMDNLRAAVNELKKYGWIKED